MSIQAIRHYEAALLEAFPRGATGDVFEHWNKARQAIANEALDKKAENARELGLDYEPAQDFVCSTGLCHYKAQQAEKREWQGLTDDEVTQQVGDSHVLRDVARAVEHVLKEKNT